MKTVQIVFSPTGGTLAAANAVTAAWPGTPEIVDLADPHTDFSHVSFASDDLVLIAMPTFGGRAPSLAIERLKMIHGGNARCALLCVYGQRAYDDTLAEMSDTAAACGFRVIGAIVAVAEHSIVNSIAAGRPDESDNAELTAFGNQILERVKKQGDTPAPVLPGNRPYKKEGPVFVPKAGKDCTECGACAKSCPAEAIDASHPKKGDPKKCVSCMRCVSVCPKGSRQINSIMRAAAGAMLRRTASQRKANELY